MNAIILAAGMSSRFVPLSFERPKGLIDVKGDILIERQIRQLQAAGISDITLVLGYKADMFLYLVDKFNVKVVFNEDYERFNNSSSLIRVIDTLSNTFLCCSDHYFDNNVFLLHEKDSYYSALYSEGPTKEYCIATGDQDWITDVRVGGSDCWYMAGHVYFTEACSFRFRDIFKEAYQLESTRKEYWEDTLIRHLHELPIKIRRFQQGEIREFDSLDELRAFDPTYLSDTRSAIVKAIVRQMGWKESDLSDFHTNTDDSPGSFHFKKEGRAYRYSAKSRSVSLI